MADFRTEPLPVAEIVPCDRHKPGRRSRAVKTIGKRQEFFGGKMVSKGAPCADRRNSAQADRFPVRGVRKPGVAENRGGHPGGGKLLGQLGEKLLRLYQLHSRSRPAGHPTRQRHSGPVITPQHVPVSDQKYDGMSPFPLTPAPLPRGEGTDQTLSPGERVAEGRVRGDRAASSSTVPSGARRRTRSGIRP